MIRIAALAGLALLCFVLSSCAGTYRAITNDYATDAPFVESISPLHGVSGEEVTFEATLCLPSGTRIKLNEETGELEYNGLAVWNFGGGAEPNISHDLSPTVILRDGLRSPYECSLYLKGNCTGDEDNLEATYTFTLSVAPLTVIGVTPTTGSGGSSAVFSAIVGSGIATDYAWDFGGACSPNGANVANPNVNFVDFASGPYNCRVIISNDYELYEFPFVLQVTPKPAEN
ncbi:hypothetical protein JW859_15240 [bacterium]|nr:hypothetical protein [bacterium]